MICLRSLWCVFLVVELEMMLVVLSGTFDLELRDLHDVIVARSHGAG